MNHDNELGHMLRNTFAVPEMSEGEILTRAREAYIATHRRLPRIMRRWIRAGWLDRRVRATITALRDVKRPMALIVAERDEATVALVMRTSPHLPQTEEVAAALLTAVRMGRRG